MNISTFKIFRDLVEARSFSKSAVLNSITQSAVSQQIANLEKRLKCLLVERGGKGFALTAEGQRFYEGCYTLTEVYKKLLTELQEMSRCVSGSIRISVIDSIGLYDLPPFIKSYSQQYPLVKVYVDHRHSDQVYEDVLMGTADLGVVAFLEKKSRLEIKLFQQDRLVLICNPKHRLANFKAMPIRQIAGCKFIGFDTDLLARKTLDALFKKHRINISPATGFGDIEMLKRTVENDGGVALVPRSSITQEVKNRTLKVVEFTDEEILRSLGVIYRRGYVFSPASKTFLAMFDPKEVERLNACPSVDI